MSAQHTPGPTRAIFDQAFEFTLLVERFIRGDLLDDVEPVTEGRVTDEMYSLRAAIAKASGSAA